VQAKAYDPAYRAKKADVDSFLSESARPEFSYRLLIAATDLIGETARRTLAGQEKPAGVLLRSQLARAGVSWPRTVGELAPAPPLRKHALGHQHEAVAEILTGFSAHDRGQVVMACGTGKTLVGLLVAEALASQRTLVLVPSLSLLAQTLREWTANGLEAFEFLAVCSDETVLGEDAVVSTTSESVTRPRLRQAPRGRGRWRGVRLARTCVRAREQALRPVGPEPGTHLAWGDCWGVWGTQQAMTGRATATMPTRSFGQS